MKLQFFQRFLRRVAYTFPGGFTFRPLLHRMRGVTIGKNVWISQYVYIDEIHPESIAIGDNSSIGIHTSIISHFYWGPRKQINPSIGVTIGNNVFIGPHCVILPNVTIGDGSIIQAGTVVSRNVPPGVLWGASKAGVLALASVPLTSNTSYEQFMKGLRSVY